MSARRSPRRAVLGATLIEALVSIAVLGLGTAGVAQLVQSLTNANERAEFQNRSLEVYSRFVAEVMYAPCDVYPNAVNPSFGENADPGLHPELTPGADDWQEEPVKESLIQTVGRLDSGILARYRVEDYDAVVKDSNRPPAIHLRMQVIQLEAGEIKSHKTRDYPVTKVCNYTDTEAPSRGNPLGGGG